MTFFFFACLLAEMWVLKTLPTKAKEHDTEILSHYEQFIRQKSEFSGYTGKQRKGSEVHLRCRQADSQVQLSLS